MKASKLLKIIRENLQEYPIDYLRNKVTDERYKDPLTKKLAKYNTSVYDDIYETIILDDFEIKDNIIENITSDLNFYFDHYGPGDEESQNFTRSITLYLALISKKPIHPYSENKKDEIFYSDGKYYCKNRIKYINDEKTLCKYCVCNNVGYNMLF